MSEIPKRKINLAAQRQLDQASGGVFLNHNLHTREFFSERCSDVGQQLRRDRGQNTNRLSESFRIMKLVRRLGLINAID
jgi:hypothetical protein